MDYMHVSQLVPLDQKVISIPHDGRVREALNLMRSHCFDQLPVQADDGSVVGLFSYRSFAIHLEKFRASDDALSKLVGDLADEPFFVRPTENLSNVIEKIKTEGAVLIGSEQDLYAVATTGDLSDFIWKVSQPFILIGDIEMTLRRIMNASCPAAELPLAISRALQKSVASLEELTMGELLYVLKNGPNFGQYFKARFHDMNFMSQTLDPVLAIRNRVFHFLGEPSDDDLEKLRAARGWLDRKWRATRTAVPR